jgi:hypothetical protein
MFRKIKERSNKDLILDLSQDFLAILLVTLQRSDLQSSTPHFHSIFCFLRIPQLQIQNAALKMMLCFTGRANKN